MIEVWITAVRLQRCTQRRTRSTVLLPALRDNTRRPIEETADTEQNKCAIGGACKKESQIFYLRAKNASFSSLIQEAGLT